MVCCVVTENQYNELTEKKDKLFGLKYFFENLQQVNIGAVANSFCRNGNAVIEGSVPNYLMMTVEKWEAIKKWAGHKVSHGVGGRENWKRQGQWSLRISWVQYSSQRLRWLGDLGSPRKKMFRKDKFRVKWFFFCCFECLFCFKLIDLCFCLKQCQDGQYGGALSTYFAYVDFILG